MTPRLIIAVLQFRQHTMEQNVWKLHH